MVIDEPIGIVEHLEPHPVQGVHFPHSSEAVLEVF